MSQQKEKKDTKNIEERITEFYTKYQKILNPLLVIIGGIILGILIAPNLNWPPVLAIFAIYGLSILGYILIRFVNFYRGEARMEQEFNQFYASHFLSTFYKIYFPVIILALIGQVITDLLLRPAELGGTGILDYTKISPTFMLRLIVGSLLTGLGIMALVDYEMKKKNLSYSDRVGQTSFVKSFGYIIPLSGLYFGSVFIIRFIIRQIWGPAVLIPSQNLSFNIDYGVNRVARIWDLLSDVEKTLILITFVVIYIAMEFLLRGLVTREAKGYHLGGTSIVFVPAVIQAMAFTSGVMLFTDTIYYLYSVFDALMLGFVMGIIIWRTGNFKSAVFSALFIRLLDTRVQFQEVVLKSLPRAFGTYNPSDNVTTLSETLGNYFIYIQIFLVAIAPFIIIVSYEEVGKVAKNLYAGLKSQWFGILVMGLAFFIIDLVFSFITSSLSSLGALGVFVGFMLALFVLRFVLGIFFQVLPPPNQMPILDSQGDMFDGELPLNLKKDIEYLDSTKSWYEFPKRMGYLGAFGFIYFLFLSATYRQLVGLTPVEIIKFFVFLVILPTALIGSATYLISRAYSKGFFFAEKWRTTLINLALVMYVINVLIWTNTTSTVNFSWRLIPFGVFFILLLWPKPIENPVMDLAHGLARDGRYATFRYMEDKSDLVEEEFTNLLDLPSDNIIVGTYILAARHGIIDGDTLLTNLRNRKAMDSAEVIGSILAVGLLRFKPAEGVILDILTEEDLNNRMAGYWVLGKIGTKTSLSRMAKILEENPKKDLVPIAETAILSIDPNYPLAGIRDSIQIA